MKTSVTFRSMRLLSFIAMFIVVWFVSSCSESDDEITNTSSRVPYQCASCINASEALPENDNSSNGIYKGVFANGAFELNVRNNSDEIRGLVFLNNTKIEMFGVSATYTKGELTAILRGALDGKKFSMTFWVSDDGSNPKVYNFSLPNGQLIASDVIKETSNSLQESFEGKYYVKKITQNNGMPDYEDKVDNPFPPTTSIINKGTVRFLVSRSNARWISSSTINDHEASVDFGNIIEGKLVSDRTQKAIATLVSDELNNVDYSSGNSPLYMYSIRVR